MKENRILQIGGCWPEVTDCDNPINLNWHHFGYSVGNKRIRFQISWLVTIAIFICMIISANYFTYYIYTIKSPFKVANKCPSVVS